MGLGVSIQPGHCLRVKEFNLSSEMLRSVLICKFTLQTELRINVIKLRLCVAIISSEV